MTTLKDYHPRAIGLSWFRKDDYTAIRRVSADGHKMPDTWEKWLKGAEKMEQEMKADFDIVERIYIDPSTFPAWCTANSTSVDSQGRHKFVAMAIAEKYGRTH